jgi:adenosylhomocysteine nucleosidase
MKILVIAPFPVEFNASRDVLGLTEGKKIAGLRSASAMVQADEWLALQCGPGKARAAVAACIGIREFKPDLLLDSGSCAGIQPGLAIGQIILADHCIEYDLGGSGLPRKDIPEMHTPSGFHFLPQGAREYLLRRAFDYGKQEGLSVVGGSQACGEFLIDTLALRERLYRLFHAAGANWESAGVFIAGLRHALPVLSARVITDLGNKDALRDFHANIKPCTRNLYRFIKALQTMGWFAAFKTEWNKLDGEILAKLPVAVLP